MQHNQKIGKFGEDLAVNFLLKRNYKILHRNRQFSHQEIDIIASIGTETVFVEVKTRILQTSNVAEEAINYKKIKNIKYAIMNYSYTERVSIDTIRMDVLVVNICKIKKVAKIKHYIEIF